MRSVVTLTVAVVATLSFAPRAAACVSGIVSAGSLVTTDSQLALISVHEGTSDIAVLLTVPAASEEFGALIPLPSRGEPTIDAVAIDGAAFASLEAATRPVFEDFSGDEGGGGFGCGTRALSGDSLGEKNSRGVIAGESVDVGPVTAQWLVADDSSALTAYLADNGFALPAGGTAVIDGYLAEGNGFLAFKRNDAASADAVAVGIHFSVPGDLRVLPLRIAQLGAPDVLPVTVFIAAEEAVGLQAPWNAVHVGDLDDAAAIADYAGLVDELTAEASGKLWIFEGSVGKGSLEQNQLTALIDDGAVLSRLSARIPSAQLDVDASFTAAAPGVKEAVAAAAFALPRNVDLAALALVGVTLVVRRRRR